MNTNNNPAEFRQSNNGMSGSKQILVVEDDEALRKLLLLTAIRSSRPTMAVKR